jgi:LPPG:FO 2-phospho-L-lactate transferase
MRTFEATPGVPPKAELKAELKIVALAGGIGGARFLRGLQAAAPDAAITVIGNTGDDIELFGLRISPDLDTVMYTLGNGIHEEQGWGRRDETFVVKEELALYGVQPQWFGLGDRDIATHIVRTQMRNAGYPLSQVTSALCARWNPGVDLLPMTDDRVETHVEIEDEEGRRFIHFQEWWIKYRANTPALRIVPINAESATPAPGVIEAIKNADVILFPPSNPVVSIGTILAIPGIKRALLASKAPLIGISPIIGGSPVRGMADACLAAIDVKSSAYGVAEHYGARAHGGLLHGWLVDDVDRDCTLDGLHVLARPLLMKDLQSSREIAAAALDLARSL